MPLANIGIVVLISAALVFALRRVRGLNVVGGLTIPFGVAYAYYWLPVWLNPPNRSDINSLHRLDMYNAWAFLGVGMTFVPALLVSAVIVAVAERRRREKGTPT